MPLNFEIHLINSQIISKKPFQVQTGSRFSATTIFGHYFYRTWEDIVWISKIRPIVIIWTKNLFLNATFDLPSNTGSRFLKPKVVCSIPGQTQAFAVWILKIRAQLANHLLKHNSCHIQFEPLIVLTKYLSLLFFVSSSLFLLNIFSKIIHHFPVL